MSDVRLEDGVVAVEGHLRVEGPDIKLDERTRRDPENSARHRRALVHGSNDELIVNFANDFNSVTINARDDAAIRLKGGTIHLDGDTRVQDLELATIIRMLLEERRSIMAAINGIERHLGMPVSILNSEIDIPDIDTDIDIDLPRPRIPRPRI
ncbi:hypothetical protein HME9302_00112 [Alteripontixanthobacter maritimus]|uniref:Uncharacterized protein n=1 Tax=Alteripontixanthobacter maritimus TaxID=2161824 RepID=A0A369Q712_9SPHN|nr:hypothetical protein [Alteripontixanthobacter maritimus]RDC58936.1 hypothetical protein HME9302_00112 [Alteripontixanthobacter maritimus]